MQRSHCSQEAIKIWNNLAESLETKFRKLSFDQLSSIKF